MIIKLSRSIRACFERKYWARATRHLRKKGLGADRAIAIIRTWLGEKSFRPDGSFHDGYFADLAEHLRQQGGKVVILPIFYNLHRSIKDAFIWLRTAQEAFSGTKTTLKVRKAAKRRLRPHTAPAIAQINSGGATVDWSRPKSVKRNRTVQASYSCSSGS